MRLRATLGVTEIATHPGGDVNGMGMWDSWFAFETPAKFMAARTDRDR